MIDIQLFLNYISKKLSGRSLKKFAGMATVPDRVISCCQIDKSTKNF